MLLRLSALANAPLIPGETLIFPDVAQVCKEIITTVKFLVEDGSYEYILSGSLLGIELKNMFRITKRISITVPFMKMRRHRS